MNTLVDLLKPLIQTSAALELQQAPSVLPLTASKFGGKPYLESGESWPQCPTCHRTLTFICQLDLRQTSHPSRVKVPFITFYYCWDCFPWGFSSEAAEQWVVRTYQDPNETKASSTKYPNDMDFNTECQVLIQEHKSLPDWESHSRWCPEATAIARELNSDAPWEAYQQAVKQLIQPNEMGELFKVMALTKQLDITLNGFQLHDKRMSLG